MAPRMPLSGNTAPGPPSRSCRPPHSPLLRPAAAPSRRNGQTDTPCMSCFRCGPYKRTSSSRTWATVLPPTFTSPTSSQQQRQEGNEQKPSFLPTSGDLVVPHHLAPQIGETPRHRHQTQRLAPGSYLSSLQQLRQSLPQRTTRRETYHTTSKPAIAVGTISLTGSP